MKKIPERKCIGCNTHKSKDELIRIVKDKNGLISIEDTVKKEGRGAYICKSMECLNLAIKKKKLEREFKSKIDESIYINMEVKLNG